jgi:hypothetical protein
MLTKWLRVSSVLWLVFDGLPLLSANFPVATEATIRGGANANLDVNEAADGYVMVKNIGSADSTRKAYFQFDVTGFSGDTNKTATFSINYQSANPQDVQLWALNQACPGFSASVTWNTAPANDTNSNDLLLTAGPFTATRVGRAGLLQPATANDWDWFIITNWGNYVFNGKITLVLSGLTDTTNSAGGLRIDRFQSVLRIPPATNPPLPGASHWEVYLLGGQSNMDGRAGANQLSGDLAAWSMPQTNVRIWYANPLNYNHPLTPNYNTGWQVLEPGFSVPSDFPPSPVPSPCFGPELSFVTSLAAANPDLHVALIKVTQGGTDLNTEWNPFGGYMYVCLTNTARAALEALATEGASYTLRGMIWHQGENDTSGTAATNYETNLTQFITAVRRDFGVTNLPFVVGELATNQSTYTIVRQAQLNVAQKVPYVGFASSDALQTIDRVHFDAAGAVSMGQRMAAALEVPPLKFVSATCSGSNLVLTASGLGAAPCRLLSSTDLAVPIATWIPVSSNAFDAQGRLTFTRPITPATNRQFYVIQLD